VVEMLHGSKKVAEWMCIVRSASMRQNRSNCRYYIDPKQIMGLSLGSWVQCINSGVEILYYILKEEWSLYLGGRKAVGL